ncbi:DnaT-like ssDNA-binding domain-containing protein [Leclercia adecarboxylata]
MLTLEHNTTLSDVVTRNVTRNVTVSLLVTFWSAANEHTRNGVFENADLSDMDDIVGVPGFGEALSTVGWVVHDEENNCVILPNFNEYNTSGEERSASAKTNAQRQREFRERQKLRESNVTRNVTNNVTSNRREEKRREDIKPERESACEAFTPPEENPSADGSLPGSGAAFPPIGKFPITSNWMPQPEFARRATLWGKNLGTEPGYTVEELQQFRDYWSCDGRVKHQQQWEMAFADSLLQSRGRIQRSKPAGARDPNRISEPDKKIPAGFRGQP